MSLEQRQGALDAIADQCRLSRSTLLVSGDEVRLRPEPTAEYESVDCALEKLKQLPGLGMKMGFVGNEAYTNESQ